MHELSLCQNIVKQLQVLVEEHDASTVSVVRLKIGPLSGVDPELMQHAFPAASAETVASNAVLEIENTPIRVTCQSCGKESEVTTNKLLCTSCGSNKTTLNSGDEMLLVDVEMTTT